MSDPGSDLNSPPPAPAASATAAPSGPPSASAADLAQLAERVEQLEARLGEQVGPLRDGLAGLVDRVRQLEAGGNVAATVEQHNRVLHWLLGDDGWLKQYYRGHFEVPTAGQGQPNQPQTAQPQVATLVPPEPAPAAIMPALPPV